MESSRKGRRRRLCRGGDGVAREEVYTN